MFSFPFSSNNDAFLHFKISHVPIDASRVKSVGRAPAATNGGGGMTLLMARAASALPLARPRLTNHQLRPALQQMLELHWDTALGEALIPRQRAWCFTEPWLPPHCQQQPRKRARREVERSSSRRLPEPNSANHSAQSWAQRSRKCASRAGKQSSAEHLSLGNELGASLSPCALSAVSYSLGKEQGEKVERSGSR